jgi:hypothetical protein
MEAAGPVNPHLPTAEDHELCMRIRNAGYKLARIHGRMAVKFTENRQTLHEVLRRSRTKMFDYGTVIRYAGQYGCAWQFSIESLSYILSFCVGLLGLLIATPIAYYFGVLWVLGLVMAVAGLAMIIKKGGVHAAAVALAGRAASTYRTIVSYVRTQPKPIEEYPTDVIHVR